MIIHSFILFFLRFNFPFNTAFFSTPCPLADFHFSICQWLYYGKWRIHFFSPQNWHFQWGGLSYVSPSPRSKGRFSEITDVRLANMLNLVRKHVEKEKEKENLDFLFAPFHLLLQSWTCVKLVPISYRGEKGGCRDGGAFWNVEVKEGGGGHLPPSHTHTPTQIFQNALWVVRWQKQNSSQ